MQQFVVPQFIEVEDKIFGPITTRQFLIMLVAGTIVFLAYRFADFTLFIFLAVFVGGFSLILAFVKVHGQTFHYFLLNIFQNIKKPSLRIWKKGYGKDELNYFRLNDNEIAKVAVIAPTTIKKERIRDLALLVNTGGFYRPEEDV
ncbi:MAG: PrgI family protein [Patescibacteria group bacterium]